MVCTYMGSTRALAYLGLSFLICKVGRMAPTYCEVLSLEHCTHACPDQKDRGRPHGTSTRSSNLREQYGLLL